MALLGIIQDVARRLALPVPTAVIGSTDPMVQQMLALTQDIGDDLVERWNWLKTKSGYNPVTFTGDGTTAVWTFPVDFQSLSPSDIFVSNKYPSLVMPGPVNEEYLIRAKATPANVQPSCWRRIGNQIEFYPVLTAGEIVSYVYAGKRWIVDADGVTRKDVFAADTDTVVYPERLVRYGLLWKYRRAKGLDYGEEFDAFETAFDRIAGEENQDRNILMSDDSYSDPDNWFPGSLTYTPP